MIDSPALTVSVAMCTYNGARYLPAQLASILEQTVLPDEMIVCDDQSTDSTISLVEEFAQSAPFPVKIHVNPVRLGFSQNFAKCTAQCAKDITILTDQDDIWFPDRVERTRAAFSSDSGLAYTFSDAPLIDETGKALGKMLYASVRLMKQDRARLEEGTQLIDVILRWGSVYGCTMAYRTKFASYILPVPSDWSHDQWFALMLGSLGHSARQQPVTYYRQHAVQVAGAGKWTLAKQLKHASKLEGEIYLDELRHYQDALVAAKERQGLDPYLFTAISGRIRFLEDRISATKLGIRGLPQLLRISLRGDYQRFAAGARSLLKDAAMALRNTMT